MRLYLINNSGVDSLLDLFHNFVEYFICKDLLRLNSDLMFFCKEGYIIAGIREIVTAFI